MKEADINQNALLSNDEIAVKAMQFGLKNNYPGRIRIQEILHKNFGCEWDKRLIITELIVHHGLGKYADDDQNDLLIHKEAADALQTDDPIGYIKELKEQQKRPFVQATNAIVGNNNSGNYQGQDFEVFPQSQPMTSPNQKATQSDNTEVKISKAQFIFWLFSAFTMGAAFATAVINFLKK